MSLRKKKVGAVGFDSLRDLYFFTKVTVSNRKTAHLSSAFLRFSRNTDIEGPDGCLDTFMLDKKFDFQCLSVEPLKK